MWQQAGAPGGTWFNWRGSAVGTRYNTVGTGWDLSAILRSPPVCNPSNNAAYYWRTVALVQTERAGRYFYSTPQQDGGGC